MWENTAVTLPISSDVETVVMKEINDAMNNDNRPYFQAALYYLNNGKDLNQAIVWFDKAIVQQPDGYWIYHQKANALPRNSERRMRQKRQHRNQWTWLRRQRMMITFVSTKNYWNN